MNGDDLLTTEDEQKESSNGYQPKKEDAQRINDFVNNQKNSSNSSSVPKGEELKSGKTNTPSSAPKGQDISKVPSGADIGKAGADIGKAGADIGKAGANVGANTVGSAASTTASASAVGTGASVGASVGGTAVGATAAGAPTAGIGAVVVIAASVVTNTIGALAKNLKKHANEVLDNRKSSAIGTPATIFLALIVFILLLIVPIITPISVLSNIVTNIEDYAEGTIKSFSTYNEKSQFFQDLFEAEGLDTSGLYSTVNNQMTVDANNVIIYKAIIDEGIKKSYEYYILSYLTNPEVIFSFATSWLKESIDNGYIGVSHYSSEAAMQNLMNKPYYYSLPKNGVPYTVGNYLKGEIPKSDLNNDINYAEIITIFSQSKESTYLTISYSDFYEALAGKNSDNLFFEMTIDDEPTFFYWNDKEHTSFTICDSMNDAKSHQTKQEQASDEATDEEEGSTTTSTATSSDEDDADEEEEEDDGNYGWGYFYDFELYPYGLDEIYSAAGVSPTTPSYINSNYTNENALDFQENFLRSYLGNKVELGPQGTKARNLTSLWCPLYDEIHKTPVGRTKMAWCINSVTTMDIGNTSSLYGGSGGGLMVDYKPNGTSVILDVTDKYYICQYSNPDSSKARGNGKHTIGEAACIDCSYMMAAEYFNQTPYSIAKISSSMSKGGYVDGQSFQTWKFCQDFGINLQNGTKSTTDIVAQITKGNIVEIGIKGQWKGIAGRQLHNSSSEHHFIIVGYDDTGFYLADPGSQGNTVNVVSYADFAKAPIFEVRYLSSSKGNPPHYLINTLK